MNETTLLATLLLLLTTFFTPAKADKFSPTLTDEKHSRLGLPVYLRVFKEEGVIELFTLDNDTFQLIDSYPICSFSGGLGPKMRENDLKSPEGFYQFGTENLNPHSQFHLSFNIGYPNLYDRSHGYTGNHLMVHGECLSQGCYAIGNDNIEEVYHFVEKAFERGQRQIDIHIFPFRMTDKNMLRHRISQYYDFWQQLKPAYDYFENTKLTPLIYISNGRYYVFNRALS